MQDLKIIDQISMIRQRPEWFAGGSPIDVHLVTGLMRDLMLDGVVSVQVSRMGGWWVLSADQDWLLQMEGGPDFDRFRRITRFPKAGLLAIRHETVVAALSKAVVSAGAEGVTWIVGDASGSPVPPGLSLQAPNGGFGRVLAFAFEGMGETVAKPSLPRLGSA